MEGAKGASGVGLGTARFQENFACSLKFDTPLTGDGWIEIRRSATREGGNGYFVYHGVWPNTNRVRRIPSEVLQRLNTIATEITYKFQLQAEPTSFETNTWYTIEILVNRNILTTSVNGKRLSEYIDTKESYSFGAIALLCRGDSGPVQFQEVTMKSYPIETI